MKAKHWTEADEKNFQYATQPIGGWILTPTKDESGAVTGTHMWFINCANVGGNIPESLVTSQIPDSVGKSMLGTAAWLRKKKSG